MERHYYRSRKHGLTLSIIDKSENGAVCFAIKEGAHDCIISGLIPKDSIVSEIREALLEFVNGLDQHWNLQKDQWEEMVDKEKICSSDCMWIERLDKETDMLKRVQNEHIDYFRDKVS